jgi:hypothetical protein
LKQSLSIASEQLVDSPQVKQYWPTSRRFPCFKQILHFRILVHFRPEGSMVTSYLTR